MRSLRSLVLGNVNQLRQYCRPAAPFHSLEMCLMETPPWVICHDSWWLCTLFVLVQNIRFEGCTSADLEQQRGSTISNDS
jgi:hypothetical protein